MAGRKPLGPELVQQLEGSEHAKERWKLILQTLTGSRTIGQACQQLGIGEAMFHRLRNEALQAGLHRLEPRPRGRPPHSESPEAQRIAELEEKLRESQLQHQAAEVRREIEQVLARPSSPAAEKKTTESNQRRRELRKRLLQRNKRKSTRRSP